MTTPHTTLSEAVRALAIQYSGDANFHTAFLRGVDAMRNSAAALVEQHEAQEPVGEVWADINGTKRAWIEDQSIAKGTKLYAQPTLAATQAGDADSPVAEKAGALSPDVMREQAATMLIQRKKIQVLEKALRVLVDDKDVIEVITRSQEAQARSAIAGASPAAEKAVDLDSMPPTQESKYGIRDGKLFNRASGEFIPADEPVFIFRARDAHAVNVLASYAREVRNSDHAAAVWKRVEDFKRFWDANPDRMKQPDTASPTAVAEGGLSCWSCKKPYTLAQRSEADGNCPHCGVEIELDDAQDAYEYRHLTLCAQGQGFDGIASALTELERLRQPAVMAGGLPSDMDLSTALTVFDMGLGFALCHRDFGETRQAIKKLQGDFTAIRALIAANSPTAEKKPRTTVTVERVRELFTYDPDTGKIYHKADRKGGVHAGMEIGHTHVSGQRFLTADRKRLGLHRVAWAIYYGEWPEGMVDHINRNPLDNRIANLRIATYSQNGTNYLRSSRTGYRGVRSLRGKAWQASIKKDGKVTHLGTFQNIEDAAEAYNVAAKAMHGEFAVLNPIGEDRQPAKGEGDL